MPLQPRPISYVVWSTLLPPYPLRTPVQPLVLLSLLLPWTVWIFTTHLSTLSFRVLPLQPKVLPAVFTSSHNEMVRQR
jgi:hypothetical protein